MSLDNIDDLKEYFINNPHSKLFSVLSEYYLLNNQIDKAQKICDIGFKSNFNSLDGMYVQSRIFILNEDFSEAEKILKKIIKTDPFFFNAYILLSEIYWKQGSLFDLKKILKKILFFDPKSKYANDGLKKINQIGYNKSTVSIKNKKLPIGKYKSSIINTTNEKSINDLKISKDLATFTMVEIFQNQKLYNEALAILTIMMTKKGLNKDNINSKKTELIELLKQEKLKK